jgi:hypothetical protein
MIFCEDCRIRNKYRRPVTYPYHNHGMNVCELCNQRKDCYDYPALMVKAELTAEEKLLDAALQSEYHKKADDLVICYITGSRAGAVDNNATEILRKVSVQNNGETDWYATYELRLKVQDGYRVAKNRR